MWSSETFNKHHRNAVVSGPVQSNQFRLDGVVGQILPTSAVTAGAFAVVSYKQY